ncbi:MAG: cell division protein FtsQ/DivIB, partial [Candidatus Omnitrophica bacterium]|nr:cell division protein FtsQ/DivIB [Candidatus Omnitrophota bacterium]
SDLDVVVTRVLPDKLSINLNFRVPVALLGGYRYYPVDKEGVVLVNMDPAALKGLPVIKGVDVSSAGRIGKKKASGNLAAALELLEWLKKTRFFSRYNVRLINASDMRNLSFYLGDSGPQVIIGYENFKDRLGTLHDTMADPRLVMDNIDYIDVRFKDVAINPK